MTDATQPKQETLAQQAQEGLAFASALSPLFGPNAALAVQIASNLLNAAVAASNGGHDVTDEELDDLLSADDAARDADERARREQEEADAQIAKINAEAHLPDPKAALP